MLESITAAVEAPAAGSPIAQIAIATGFAGITTAVLLWLCLGHLHGRSTVLARAAQASTRWMGVEPWAALPMTIASLGLIAGGFGVFWDISLHIDVGRDEGPLANPSHYPILLALYSIFAAGVVSVALHDRKAWERFRRRTASVGGRPVGEFRPAPRALNLPGGYVAPIGGALCLLCGVFALSGFPMDDMWHRMFGQDVTLWGPTHLIMINGAILTPPILAILALESKHARGHSTLSPARSLGESITRSFIPGALLFSIAFWATEFDWGVPQYRLVWHPLLLALGAGFALVAGRLWLGRGGALKTVAFYLGARIAMEVVTALLGQTAPNMPLFLVEALIIEAIAWRMAPESEPLRFGLIGGLLCGTIGFAAEYAWMSQTSPEPWTTALLAEGLPTAIAAAVAGGLLGALLGSAMYGTLPVKAIRRRAAIGSALTLVVLGANALWLANDQGVTTAVEITPAAAIDGDRAGYVTARVTPASAAQDADWFSVLAWQTGAKRTFAKMVQQADGTWRTDKPVPLAGEGKTLMRLHKGRSMLGTALYLKRDPAIPRAGVSRPASFSAPLVHDQSLMQTERRDYVPGWLWTPAALVMLLCCAAFLVAMSVGIARATEVRPDDDGPAEEPLAPARTQRRERVGSAGSRSSIPCGEP